MLKPPSQWLYNFLRSYEKFRPTAYKPTKKDVWTIGYGHTEGVKEGDTLTYDQAEYMLHTDVAKFVAAVAPLVTVDLNQNESDAIYSLVFNIGVGRKDGKKDDFADSTLLQLLNAGRKLDAANEFPKWDHQGGMVLEGLRLRRVAERAHFLGQA